MSGDPDNYSCHILGYLNKQHIVYITLRDICNILILIFFRGEITPLSSSYNISGLVSVCWLLFQCF